MSKKRKGLGRGLEALLDAKNTLQSIDQPLSSGQDHSEQGIQQIPIERIQRGQFQPRTHFDTDELEAMAETIKSVGLMQPIVLRKLPNPEQNIDYEIIAGERRWRACQIAGLDTISATITSMEDDQVAAMALIENIQREDLNPIEEARAYHRLQQDFQLSQQQVATLVGKSRSAVANLIRLLSLDDEVRLMLEQGNIDMGHARALLSLKPVQQLDYAKKIAAKSLSVRQTEQLVKQAQREQDENQAKQIDKDTLRLQERLSEILGARVQITHQQNSGRGKVVINYNCLDELDGILGHIK